MYSETVVLTGVQDLNIETDRPLYRFEQSLKHFLYSLIDSDDGFKDVLIELRYSVAPGKQSAGDHLALVIAFIVRATDQLLLAEVMNLLELALFDGGLEYSRVDSHQLSGLFRPVDAVFFARKLSRSRPLELVSFDPNQPPDVFRLCNILLRQKIACSLHVIAQPCNFAKDDRITLEHLWGKEGFTSSNSIGDSATEPRLPKMPPFLMNVRLFSSEPIQTYLANAVGSEIAGGYSFVTWRPSDLTEQRLTRLIDDGTISLVELPVTGGESLPAVITEAYNTYFDQELLRIFRLPDRSLPGYRQKFYSRLPAPIDSLSADGILVGYGGTSATRDEIPVFLSLADRRRHLYVLGQTGTGKSTFLLNLILQDIQNGHGGCVIDPHGDLILDVLANIPAKLLEENRIVLFDPSDDNYKPGLNLLHTTATTSEQEREFILSELVATFLRMFGDETFGPIAQHYFRNACMTLMESEYEGSLVDIPRLFMNKSFRAKVLSTVRNELLVNGFWRDEIEKTSTSFNSEMLPYFNSKFGPIVGSYLIKYVIGQPTTTVDVERVLANGQTLLVSLSKGIVGPMNSALLGTFLVNKVVGAMFARAKMPEKERGDFYFYIDEFQNFVTQTIGDVLSEARKYRVSLTISHQFIDQLSVLESRGVGNRVRQAVFGNVGNLIFFRIGTGDVDDVGKVLHGVPKDYPTSMLSMENYVAVAKILCKGQPVTPFTIRTPSVYVPISDDAERAVAISRRSELLKQCGTPIDQVKKWVDGRKDDD